MQRAKMFLVGECVKSHGKSFFILSPIDLEEKICNTWYFVIVIEQLCIYHHGKYFKPLILTFFVVILNIYVCVKRFLYSTNIHIIILYIFNYRLQMTLQED